MAGRPARRPAPPRAVPEEERPRKMPPATLNPVDRVRRRLEREPAVLSASYRRALDADLSIREATDADAVQKGVLRQMAESRRLRGDKLRVADVLAAALIGRAADRGARDGVLAVRELADRTEGPVVQRTQDVSVRYVVSVTPAGALGAPSPAPLSLSEWEASARRDWEAARLPAAPADPADPSGGGA